MKLTWIEQAGEFRSGQIRAREEITYWLVMLGGIGNNNDKELAGPQDLGQVKYGF